MSHQSLHGERADDVDLFSGMRFGTMVLALAGTHTMDRDGPVARFLDPGGAGRTVLLPPEEEGLIVYIGNMADAAEDLTVKEDSGTTTIATVSQSESALFVCGGGVWTGGVLKAT